MPLWDGAKMLAAFNDEAGLEDANELDDEDDIYPRLSTGQVELIRHFSTITPNPFYTVAPFQLTADGDRKTFTLGNDAAGNPNIGMGWVQISPNQNAFSGDDFVGWVEGRDFIDEGDRIRVVSNRAYAGTLWCRAVLTPPDISAAQAPVISPISARRLVAIMAVKLWALEGNQNMRLAAAMESKLNDRYTGIPSLMLTYKKRYRGGGAGWDPARWYFASSDLGTSGS